MSAINLTIPVSLRIETDDQEYHLSDAELQSSAQEAVQNALLHSAGMGFNHKHGLSTSISEIEVGEPEEYGV
jgi:hypothetical protein